MSVWQQLKCTVCFSVILHKDQIPYLYYQRMIFIYQLTSWLNLSFFIRSKIDMNLRTGSTWPLFPHLPKIILLASIKDSFCRKKVQPVIISLFIFLKLIVFTPLKDSGIKSVLRQAHAGNQKLPGPFNSFLFKIVTKRPVS